MPESFPACENTSTADLGLNWIATCSALSTCLTTFKTAAASTHGVRVALSACCRSRTDSDGYGAFSPPSPGTPVTPRLGSGVGPAPGQTLGGSGLAPGVALPTPALFVGGPADNAGGLSGGPTQPAGLHGTDGARPLQASFV
jgi:hypothetical protein